MSLYAFYNTTTGKINFIADVSAATAAANVTSTQNYIATTVTPDQVNNYYVVLTPTVTVTAKVANPTTVTPTTIPADGVTAAVFSSVPAGSFITIVGPVNTTTVSASGIYSMTETVAGTYSVTVSSGMSYADFTATITVNASQSYADVDPSVYNGAFPGDVSSWVPATVGTSLQTSFGASTGFGGLTKPLAAIVNWDTVATYVSLPLYDNWVYHMRGKRMMVQGYIKSTSSTAVRVGIYDGVSGLVADTLVTTNATTYTFFQFLVAIPTNWSGGTLRISPNTNPPPASSSVTLDSVFMHVVAPTIQAAIAAPSGGTTVDAEARTAIASILAALTAQGITN